MVTKVKHYRTSTAGRIPSASNVEVGQIAINLADRLLYTKNDAGQIIQVGGAYTTGDYVLKTGDTMTGNLTFQPTDVGSKYTFIDGKASDYDTPITVRSIRNNISSTWLWETYSNGKFCLSTGQTPRHTDYSVQFEVDAGRIAAKGAPTAAAHLTRKDYVDREVSNKVPLSGVGFSLNLIDNEGLKIGVAPSGISDGWSRGVLVGNKTVDAKGAYFGAYGVSDKTHYAHISVDKEGGSYNSLDSFRVYDTYCSWGNNKIYHEGNKPDSKVLPNAVSQWGSSTNTDFNTLDQAGYYKMQNGKIPANGPNHYPYGMMEVIRSFDGDSEHRALQIYYPHKDSEGFSYRMRNSSVWNSWSKVYTDRNKPAPSEIGAVAQTGSDMSGGINFSGISNPTQYTWVRLPAYAAGTKTYLRKFRGGGSDTIWHETVQQSTLRWATGGSDNTTQMELTAGRGLYVSGEVQATRLTGSTGVQIIPERNNEINFKSTMSNGNLHFNLRQNGQKIDTFIFNNGSSSETAFADIKAGSGLFSGNVEYIAPLLEGSQIDFNDYIKTSTYNVYGAAGMGNPPPTGMNYGTLHTMGSNSAGKRFAAQTFYERDGKRIAYRARTDNTDSWTSWSRLYHEKYKPSSLLETGEGGSGIHASHSNEINFTSSHDRVYFNYRQVGGTKIRDFVFCDGNGSSSTKGHILCHGIKADGGIFGEFTGAKDPANDNQVYLTYIGNQPCIRYAGTGGSASSGFAIRGTGDSIKMSVDESGTLKANRLDTNSTIHAHSLVGNKQVLHVTGGDNATLYHGNPTTIANQIFETKAGGKLRHYVKDSGNYEVYTTGNKPQANHIGALRNTSQGEFMGSPSSIGDTTGWGNGPAAGTYTQGYSGYSGLITVSPAVGGSTNVVAQEFGYNGYYFFHTNTDGTRWNTHRVITSTTPAERIFARNCGINAGTSNEINFTSNSSTLYFNWAKNHGGTTISKFVFTGGNGSPSSRSAIDCGTLTSSGNVTAYSDERVKTDIKIIDHALDKVSQLRGVTYVRTDTEGDKRHCGVIAQEVLTVLPEVVLGGPTEEDPDALYSVAYGNMVGLLIECVKELKVSNDTLTKRIEELENAK